MGRDGYLGVRGYGDDGVGGQRWTSVLCSPRGGEDDVGEGKGRERESGRCLAGTKRF